MAYRCKNMLYYRDRKIIKPNSVPITKELVMLVKTRPFKKKTVDVMMIIIIIISIYQITKNKYCLELIDYTIELMKTL